MKHLRKYNESVEDIISDIKDILLELQDEGFVVDYAFGRNKDNDVLIFKTEISICKFRNKLFKYDEISEVIERLKDFMKGEGYLTKIYKTKNVFGLIAQVNIWFTFPQIT